MKPVCAVTRPVIVSSVAEGRGVPTVVRGHRDRCLRCHALESRVRLTQRHLASVPYGDDLGLDLVEAVLDDLERPPPATRPRAWRPLAAGTAGIMVALAVLVVRKRLVATA